MELRIYYEALEQAVHFVKPILDSIVINGQSLKITLVRLRGKLSTSNELSAVLYWKKPDMVVTAIDTEQNVENVLFVIEFSTAVFTKDHELQRFDNYIPLLYSDFIHVKISSDRKRSPVQIGGDTTYDGDLPLALVYKETDKVVYKYDWETKDGAVVTDEAYLSCPPEIPAFTALLRRGVANHATNPSEWIRLTNEQDPSYRERLEMLRQKSEDSIEDVARLRSSRTTFVRNHPATKRSSLVVKINRFGHAMDPERGILVYYGFVYDSLVTKFVLSARNTTWYRQSNNEVRIREYISEHGLRNTTDYLECFLLGATVPENMAAEIRQACSGSGSVAIDSIISRHYTRLSKPLRVIFSFSNAITIHDSKERTVLTLTFDRHPIVKRSTESPITPLGKFCWTEDVLTYCIVHRVLKQNGLKVLSVSYPGAQGDRVMLVQRSRGRNQERKYIDVVMTLRHDIVGLLENKDKAKKLEADVRDLQKYKSKYKEAVVDFARRYSDMDTTKPLQVRIGAGFVRGKRGDDIKRYQFLLDLDYFIAVDAEHCTWSIWHHESEPLFTHTKGRLDNLPETHTTD